MFSPPAGAAPQVRRSPHLPPSLDGLVHLLQEVPLPAPLGVADGRGVRGLGDEDVGATLVDPGRPASGEEDVSAQPRGGKRTEAKRRLTPDACRASCCSRPESKETFNTCCPWRSLGGSSPAPTHRVDHRLRAHLNVDHGSSQDVACVVRLDLQLVVHLVTHRASETGAAASASRASDANAHLHRLVEVQGNHFLHAVFDHLRGEEVRLSLFVDGDLAEVFQQDGADGLGGVRHVDGPIVAHHLAHEGQRAAVVQVEMAGGRSRRGRVRVRVRGRTSHWLTSPT